MRILKEQEKNIIAIGMVSLLVILVLPLLMLAKYNVMSADDYAYALMSDPVWNASNSIWMALLGEAKAAIDYWREWQGTYFSEWLSFVLTSAFAKDAYYIVTWITVIPLALCMIYLGYVLIRRGMGQSWSDVLICTIPWIIYQILLPPSGVEAFYWMCGAVLYTTAFAISILHVSINISVYIDEKKDKNIRPYEIVILLFLGFVQGGMNYIIGLPVLSLMFFMLVFDFFNRRKGAIIRAILLVWNIGWMCVSIFSPGAANRQEYVGGSHGAIWAIIHSFIEAFKYIKLWGGSIFVVVLAVVMIPVYWALVNRCNFKFKWPVAVTALSFCIYATAFTPNLYAIGIIGAYRIQNVYRFMLFIFLAINEVYWLGYIRRVLGNKTVKLSESKVFTVFGIKLMYAIVAIAIIAPMLKYYVGNTLTSYSAYVSLKSGVAQKYYEETLERERILIDESVEDAVLESYTWPPYLLFFDDIETDANDWKNTCLARYYGKKSVRLSVKTD